MACRARGRTLRSTSGNGRAPRVDAAWHEHLLIAELDSYPIHTTRRNFETDRARDRGLTVAGWQVVRITWRQLYGDRASLATELRSLLALVPGTPPPARP